MMYICLLFIKPLKKKLFLIKTVQLWTVRPTVIIDFLNPFRPRLSCSGVKKGHCIYAGHFKEKKCFTHYTNELLMAQCHITTRLPLNAAHLLLLHTSLCCDLFSCHALTSNVFQLILWQRQPLLILVKLCVSYVFFQLTELLAGVFGWKITYCRYGLILNKIKKENIKQRWRLWSVMCSHRQEWALPVCPVATSNKTCCTSTLAHFQCILWSMLMFQILTRMLTPVHSMTFRFNFMYSKLFCCICLRLPKVTPSP